jgi:M-phase inducer tyrosine phosphatase
MLNNALYPKIYYPEVYILEGGYCGFYNSRPVSICLLKQGLELIYCQTRCEPQGYIPMDDPKHFERRNSDLHDFRKFARTRSFTYGETQPSMSLGGGRPPLGMCPPLAFAAASAAIGRRHGPTITEEDHDHDLDSSPAPGNCLTGSPGGNNDSPCPRVVSMGNAPVFGSAKPRQLTRVGFHRVASYAGSGFSKR